MNLMENPFKAKPGPARRLERITLGCFRTATYSILLCGLIIFGNIFFQGSKTVFQSSFPFINTDFFTKSPETLYVFEYEGQKLQLGDAEFRTFKSEKEAEARALSIKPKEVKVLESYVYSAGGIFPNIVGTLLLVI